MREQLVNIDELTAIQFASNENGCGVGTATERL